MKNFAYAVEGAFVDYLQNVVTGSMTYPIYKGHTDNWSGSNDYPKIAVMLEDYEEVIPYSGVYKGSLVIDIVSHAKDSASYDGHDLAVSQVEYWMNDQVQIQNWINSPSTSLWVAGCPSDGVKSMFEGKNFLNSHRFCLMGQQMVPSSSYSSFGS